MFKVNSKKIQNGNCESQRVKEWREGMREREKGKKNTSFKGC